MILNYYQLYIKRYNKTMKFTKRIQLFSIILLYSTYFISSIKLRDPGLKINLNPPEEQSKDIISKIIIIK